MAFSGQRQIAFQTGFNDALYGRPSDNPYDITVVGGSHAAYLEGYEQGLISDTPPRGPKGETGEAGADSTIPGPAGSDGTNGNTHHIVSGTPGSGLGSNGDIATEQDDGRVSKKVTGSWVLQGPADAGRVQRYFMGQ